MPDAVVGELDLHGKDSSTLILALDREDKAKRMLLVLMLDDSERHWLVFHTNIDGARDMLQSLQSQIEEMQSAEADS